MNLLLDTHTLLWLADGDPKLSTTAAVSIVDPANEVFVSIASMWEVAIKSGMKKLTLSADYRTHIDKVLAAYRLTELPIVFDDCVAYETLAFPLPNHRDPFDRMLITQAQRLKLDVVGADVSFDAYGLTRHW